MKRCPKCKTLNPLGSTECDGCGVIFADIRGSKQPSIDRLCPWNDHGHVCGLVGSLSDATNGSGPWYCAKHFWKLKGYPERAGTGEHVSVRDRWYEENEQDYEPAKLDGAGKFRSVAEDAKLLHARLTSGELGKRMREPGEDEPVTWEDV